MKTITIELTDDEYRALAYDVLDPDEWVNNLVQNKIRQCIDKIMEDHTSYNPCKVKHQDKLSLVAKMSFKTAAERMAEVQTSG